MKILARININNTSNDYRDRYTLVPHIFSICSFRTNYFFHTCYTVNVQKVYLYGIMINNSETEIQEDFLEWWNLVFLFGYYENRGRKELKRPWDIIDLFRDLLFELEIMYVHSLEGERYPHYANIIEQERYISKGNFHFASLDSTALTIRSRSWSRSKFHPGRRETRGGTKGRMDETAKHAKVAWRIVIE